ncbi:hypothetical protein COCNU_07G014180 [Cocos nucifera]|uniref:DUF7963 domain-containing protein n=1 Tax=Cocos nucifera TaxID=13894 RepID=A0A8K0IFY0_COCNU|nr:hypothetical protein COCNU_07G014180 [Cocos nucifera]
MDPPAATATAMEEAAAKAVHKRYEGLMTVRTKAIKGKGAWYWAHLEPILVQSSETGLPKAVKLRCSLCDAIFSASNPSRTASEHLKRGTCPNFTSPSSSASPAIPALPSPPPKPISSIAPCSSVGHHHHHNSRKRSSSAANPQPGPSSYHHHLHASSLALIDPSRFSSSPTAASAGGDVVVYPSSATPPPPHHLVLSGGKEDLGALAMLEDSVKKLKSPKASPGPALSKAQVDSALSLLSDWFYESSGAVSLSSAEHPKFRSFLHHVGLPPLSRRDLVGPRLDARFEEARADADARIRDALFFQLSSDGWRPRDATSSSDALVSLSVNLPNGTSVFHRAVLTHGGAPSKYAEEVFWDTVSDVCGSSVQRCAGIVADRFKSTALRNLESQHNWMVNLYCQLQGFHNLLNDFARELPLFHSVAFNCCKLATFFNTKNQARGIFHKYQLQELDHAFLLCVPPSFNSSADTGSHSREIVRNFVPVFAMLEDIVASARALQLAVHDESYKLVCLEDSIARELGEMIRDMAFWADLNAVCSLVKLVKDMTQEMEAERPLVGQCLPLWNELRAKVKDWCNKFSIEEGPVKKVVEKRFEKNYHPAWSAAFILDPLYLIKDSSGKYLPPFKCLTPDQEKDVDRLITRMVSREEAHIALMELMKWRAEGLDPLYAQAVQVKKPDPVTGKMKIANPQSSRLVWETHLSEFKSLGKVAVRLIFLHATACGYKCNLSLLRWVCTHGRSRVGMDRAQKLVFVAAHAKLERRDFSNEEEKDAELFDDGEDYVLNESAFVDASSV